MTHRALLFLLLLSLLLTEAVSAQSCRAEQEPNDDPLVATALEGGCLTGRLGDQEDAQDLWLWTVGPEQPRWRLTLDGVDGALTNLEVLRVTVEDERVTRSERLFQLGTREGPATAELLLLPGNYFLGLATAGAAGRYRLDLEPVPLPASGETEPNERQAPQPVTGAFEMAGEGDTDYFEWALSDEEATLRWELSLFTPLGTGYTVTLLDSQFREVLRRSGSRPLTGIADLALDAGRYFIQVSAPARSAGTPYFLTTRATGTRTPDVEEEPNPIDRPYPLDPVTGLRGRLTGDDDYYQFEPPAEAVTVRLKDDSGELRTLCLYNGSGREMQCRSGHGSVEMAHLRLPETRYLLGVEGESAADAGYTIEAVEQAPPPANRESEPNDAYWFAPDLPASQAVRGHLTGQEEDVYRFVTHGPPQLWRVQVSGEGVRRLQILDAGGRALPLPSTTRSGRIRHSGILLLPGTHYLAVRGEESDYVLRVLSQGEPDRNAEHEPNDQPEYALPLDFDQSRRGILAAGDVDTYRFRLAATERVRLTATPPADGIVQLRMADSGSEIQVRTGTTAGDASWWEGTLLPGDYTVRLSPRQASDSAYRIRLERLPPFGTAEDETPLETVSLRLRLDRSEVAAYAPWWQAVEGTLTLTNRGGQSATVALNHHLTNDAWRLSPDAPSILLAAGEERVIPFQLDVAPDAFAAVPVILTFWVTSQTGQVAGGSVSVTPGSQTPLVGPSHRFAVPDSLLGAVDAASSALGATILTEDPRLAERQAALHLTHATDAADERLRFTPNGIQFSALPQALTVQLAGEDAVDVFGFALHPQGELGEEATGSQPAEIRLLLSSDDQSYQEVFAGRLSPQREEQFILLDTPQSARYARLVIESTHEATGRVVLDRWKVLTEPGFASGRNLTDPELGGRLITMRLPNETGMRYDFAAPQSPLTEDARPWTVSCRETCEPPAWVVAFHEQRAARIGRIEWVDSPELDSGEQWADAIVFASLDSPVGPWERIGALDLRGTPSGTHTLSFESPPWARFLRFEIPEGGSYLQRPLPAVVRVFEQDAAGPYRSILGEWGWGSQDGIYELQNPPRPAAAGADANDDTLEQATLLVAPATGQVQVAVDEDWYRVEIPPESNTLRLTVRGSPTVNVALEARDAAGETLSLTLNRERSGSTVQSWEGAAPPGQSVWVRVYEPPRSVVFAWDSSGSVSPFLPMIYQSLRRFATGVREGQEVVNLLPFGTNLLLDRWEDDPTLIVQSLQNFDRSLESSQTALNLFTATEALAARPGSRSVVLIGDFDQVHQEQAALWNLLSQVRPHLYSLRVAALPGRAESQMAAWGAVNGGGAWDTPTVSTLEVGFERAATRLRQPAGYTLEAETLFSAPPGPGALQVVTQLVRRDSAPAPTALGNTAVEIILDASGSMQQTLQGSTRIEIARGVLSDLVTGVLPAGTPLALRVFGHIEGNFSCRTDLVLPLDSHDPVALQRTILGITAQERAGTPLAASLGLVAEDLAAAEGRKLVLLLTDGEETCGGDPAAEIARLRATGIDVRVSIVGFAINDTALETQFQEWARLGGGDYFSAAGAEELNLAIEEAVRVPFRVLDGAGVEVATGSVNGEPVTLPAGTYTVELLAEPVRRYKVVVAGDSETQLVVDR